MRKVPGNEMGEFRHMIKMKRSAKKRGRREKYEEGWLLDSSGNVGEPAHFLPQIHGKMHAGARSEQAVLH